MPVIKKVRLDKNSLLGVIAVLLTLIGSSFFVTNNSSDVLGDRDFTYLVIKVIDGDTIKVQKEDNTYEVRLLGVDTPETVHPKREVECYGLEASNKAKELMLNKYVHLAEDPTQLDKDRYGRLIRYVFLQDGTHVNKLLIEQGYAYEYTYQNEYEYKNEFKFAQQRASDKRLGLWGDLCN